MALLFDTLQRPDTDFGGTAESVLTWWHETDRAIPHLVLGRNAPGGAWHVCELKPNCLGLHVVGQPNVLTGEAKAPLICQSAMFDFTYIDK